MATDPLDVPPGSLTLEAITDLLEGGGGTPAGATGDIQLNNGGVFGNANDVFPGAVLEIDATENLIIDLSANEGGLLFTGGAILASTEGNLEFQSSDGDVTFQTFDGSVVLQGTEVQITAVGADVVLSADNGGISIEEAGTINVIANAGNLNCTAAAGNMTFLSTGQMEFVSETGNVTFEANDQYTAGATTIQLNAGGDTTLILDSSANPNTITLDSDLNNTKIAIAPSVGQTVSVGNATGFHLGFFGATPVVKQTATDLASVIALLKAYGLSS